MFCRIFVVKSLITKLNKSEPLLLHLVLEGVKLQQSNWYQILALITPFQEDPGLFSNLAQSLGPSPSLSSDPLWNPRLSSLTKEDNHFIQQPRFTKQGRSGHCRLVLNNKDKFTMFSVSLLATIWKSSNSSKKLNCFCFWGAFSTIEKSVGFALIPLFRLACVFLSPDYTLALPEELQKLQAWVSPLEILIQSGMGPGCH